MRVAQGRWWGRRGLGWGRDLVRKMLIEKGRFYYGKVVFGCGGEYEANVES